MKKYDLKEHPYLRGGVTKYSICWISEVHAINLIPPIWRYLVLLISCQEFVKPDLAVSSYDSIFGVNYNRAPSGSVEQDSLLISAQLLFRSVTG